MNFDHKPLRGEKLQPLDEISGYKVRPGFYDNRIRRRQSRRRMESVLPSIPWGRPDVRYYCSARKNRSHLQKYVIRKLTVLEAHIPCWYLG